MCILKYIHVITLAMNENGIFRTAVYIQNPKPIFIIPSLFFPKSIVVLESIISINISVGFTIVCAELCGHAHHSTYVEIRKQFCGACFFFFLLLCGFLGTELRLPGLHSKYLLPTEPSYWPFCPGCSRTLYNPSWL